MVGQRDLGSSLLFFALFVVMMWVATERVSYLVIGLVLFAGAAYVSWRLFGHVQTRVDIWLDPWSDALDSGYQIVQALYGLSDGGIAGTGLGKGSPGQVPEAQNDFIFTAIGEELGLFGAAAVLIAYLLLIGAGLRTALRTENTFEKLLAVGLTTIIGVQAFIIVGGVIKVVPLTGITLPFVSYGGSSLLSNYILLALLDPPQRLRRPTPARAARRPDAGRALGGLPAAPPRRHRRTRCGARAVNRQIRQLAVGLMACYVVLFVALNYWQVGRQQELNARFDNTRAIRREFEQPRGPIVTTDGVVAAQSVENPPGSEFTYQRQYPTGDLFAHVTGYYTFAFGSTGLERTQNAVLTGSTAEQQLRNLPGIITGSDTSGTVQMALRSDLQQVAKDALGATPGSVVVLEPATGAVRAMWSYPSYDPNLIANPDFDTARDVITFLEASPGDPLLGNAYQQRYMPGSTFKILTTGIALENGVVDLTTTFPDEQRVRPAADQRPDPELPGHGVRWRPHRGVHPQLQHRVRQDRPRRRCRADGPRRRRLGRRRDRADRPPPPGRQHVRADRRSGPEPAAAGDPWLRPERGADGAAAHGDDRRGRGQRRADDEAVRRRGHPRPRRAGPRPGRSRRSGRPRSPRRRRTS